MITSQEIEPVVPRGQLQGSELLSKRYLYFTKKRLVEVKKCTFDPTSRTSIKTRNKT